MTVAAELHSISDVARTFNLSVSALRYYEEQGLIEPVRRIGRVRYYDYAALCTLAYALMWHRDANLSLGDTRDLMQARVSGERNQIIAAQLARLDEKIRLLEGAKDTLMHLLNCPADNPAECPVTGAKLRDTVNRALAGAA